MTRDHFQRLLRDLTPTMIEAVVLLKRDGSQPTRATGDALVRRGLVRRTSGQPYGYFVGPAGHEFAERIPPCFVPAASGTHLNGVVEPK